MRQPVTRTDWSKIEAYLPTPSLAVLTLQAIRARIR